MYPVFRYPIRFANNGLNQEEEPCRVNLTSQTGMDKAAYELIIMKSSLWVSIREIYLITPVVYFDPNLQLNLTSICFSSTNEINYWNKDDTALQKAKKHSLNQSH